MAERLNLHIDETGNQDLSEGRSLVAVVLHDHSADIEEAIARYRVRLSEADLPTCLFTARTSFMATSGMPISPLVIGSAC